MHIFIQVAATLQLVVPLRSSATVSEEGRLPAQSPPVSRWHTVSLLPSYYRELVK